MHEGVILIKKRNNLIAERIYKFWYKILFEDIKVVKGCPIERYINYDKNKTHKGISF